MSEIAATMDAYRRAQDGFDAVMAKIPADRWDGPSACSQWTLRDVAGHVIWAQHQIRAWGTGEDYAESAGAPGQPHPAVLASGDPVPTWRAAREASVASLTEERLGRVTSIPGIGEVPLFVVVALLTSDTVTHTWDLGHGAGMDVRLDPGLVTRTFDWSRRNVMRRPGFFGPELTPPADADEQSRMLAYLGRASWEPVTA